MDLEEYSYFQENFVDFYDQMVDTCFGGIDSGDIQDMGTLFTLLVKKAKGSTFCTVDLGTGTGRCILGILRNLKDDASSTHRLEFIGVDNSEVMLKRGREKLLKAKEEILSMNVPASKADVQMRLGWLESWDIPERHDGVDLIIAAAGPFHHLLDEKAVIQSLKQIHTHLKPGDDAMAAINLLPPEKLFDRDVIGSDDSRLSSDVFHVGQFRRRRIEHEMSVVDGARVLHERFRLSRVGSGGNIEWEQSEVWKLRELSRDDLVRMATEVGLHEIHPRFSSPGFVFLQKRLTAESNNLS